MNLLLIKWIVENWRSIVLGSLVILTGLFYNLWQNATHAYTALKQTIEATGKQQEALVNNTETKQDESNEVLDSAIKDALDTVRRDFAKRMPAKNSKAGQMPGISRTPERVEEIPTDALPLAGQCAETTVLVLGFQKWYEEQRVIHEQFVLEQQAIQKSVNDVLSQE